MSKNIPEPGDDVLITTELFLIAVAAVFWYALVPVAGAFVERKKWRFFRQRFSELRQKPFLEYADLHGNDLQKEYRFTGFFESVNSGGMLWIRSNDLTVQADLHGAGIFIFPNTASEENPAVFDPGEVPEKIKWNRISSLTREAGVFVGGPLVIRENRRIFSSLPEMPLFIIFHEGSEKTLSIQAVRAGRHKNEFFNFLTPYAFILGAFTQIIIAINYLWRPAYRMTLVAALIALFTPILPWMPPGILFTIIYRRLWFQARIYRANRDLVLYSPEHTEPETVNENRKNIVRRFTGKAYALEIISWLMLLAAIGINVFFITIIISLIQVI